MQEIIKAIKKKLKDYNNISMNFGNFDAEQLKQLKKHFKVTKELLGYYKFEKLNLFDYILDELQLLQFIIKSQLGNIKNNIYRLLKKLKIFLRKYSPKLYKRLKKIKEKIISKKVK